MATFPRYQCITREWRPDGLPVGTPTQHKTVNSDISVPLNAGADTCCRGYRRSLAMGRHIGISPHHASGVEGETWARCPANEQLHSSHREDPVESTRSTRVSSCVSHNHGDKFENPTLKSLFRLDVSQAAVSQRQLQAHVIRSTVVAHRGVGRQGQRAGNTLSWILARLAYYCLLEGSGKVRFSLSDLSLSP